MKLVADLLGSPAILVGLVACLGLIVQRKRPGDVLVGTIKTVTGVLILFAGAGAIVGALLYLTPMVQQAFGVEGLVPNNEAFVALAMAKAGGLVAWVMLGGFVVNLILARVTPWKFVFLSGHHILYVSVLLVLFMDAANLSTWTIIVIGSLVSGFLYVLLPALTKGQMSEVTNGQPIAMGHFGASGYFLAGLMGKWFGDKRTSTEDMNVPDSWQFLKETVALTSVVVTILFVILALLVGPQYIVETLNVEQHWVVFAIMQGLWFGAGLAVVITGVRMMLAEIVPAFHGIAARIVPGALPALDCPVVFPFAPNAVLLGFVCSTLAGIATTVIMKWAGGILVVPPMIQHFFMGGTAAVFGNATGGRRGAIIGACLNGVLFTVLPVLLWPFTKVVLAEPITYGDPDFCWTGMAVGAVLRWLNLIP